MAFFSAARDLTPDSPDVPGNVFVRDLARGLTQIVSRPGPNLRADDFSFGSVVSANGRVVAFESNATNLVAGDTNGLRDIFVSVR